MKEIRLGLRLRRLRNRTGWTQKRLSLELGMTDWQLSKIETNQVQPTPAQEKRILQKLAEKNG